MNVEQRRIALRLYQRATALLANLPARREAAQAAEDEDAELMGRPAREINVDPLIEVPTPLLEAVLGQVGDAVPEHVAPRVASYRLHCRRVRGLGSTNVLADQLLSVLEAAGIAPDPGVPAETAE